MLDQITDFQIFGKPLIMWTGVLALLLFIFTALISILNKRKVHLIPRKWHSRIAMIALIAALFHGTLGLFRYI